MQATFSFKYGEKPYTLSVKDGAHYELEKGVTVSVTLTEFPSHRALWWVLHFENQSGRDSEIFSEIWDCDTLLPLKMPEKKRDGYRPTEGDPCVVTMKGMVEGKYYWENDRISASEYSFTNEYLKNAPKAFKNINGRSSDGMMPFFDVTASGEGYLLAIGWTGDWKSEFEKRADGIHAKTGLQHARFYLKSGEKLRTTSVLLMRYEKGEDKSNRFRALIRDHFSYKTERKSLMAYELWGGLPSHEMKKRIGELKSHGVRFEDIWIDAGWYGTCQKCDDAFTGDWFGHTGDWRVNPLPHPEGLLDVKTAAEEADMRLMLWFEPERAIKGRAIIGEHPDWFLSSPKDGFSLILNYGNDEARQYMTNLLLDYTKRLHLSCYRQDFNTPLTHFFEASDEENRRGITEIGHITGMYRMWDDLHAEVPELLIDNCSSGGRRIDIETLSRAIPFFRSDYQCNFNENPEVLQTHNANISRYLPYNGCTSKTKGDLYAIRSAYSSSFGVGYYNAIFQEMTEEDFAWAKKASDDYLRIRKYLSADFYNHGSNTFDASAWAVFQYHDQETGCGIVLAFRRENSPFDTLKIKLRGLLPECDYTAENLDTQESVAITNGTLAITLPEKRSSVIFEYKVK